MGTRAQQMARVPGEGDLEGCWHCSVCTAPQGGLGLPPCLPLCQKMERQLGLLNAVWEPSTDGLVTRLGQCWRDASYACRGEWVVTQGRLSALGHCHPPGLSRAARQWKQTGHGGWDSQSLPSRGLGHVLLGP